MTTLPPLDPANLPKQSAKPAPYDERNAADYHEISLRIAKALETIEHDELIPVTQTALTQLADCSRGTLRNRGWPLDRLKLIKEKRAAKPASPPPQAATEIEHSDRKKLYADLQASRTEAAKRFDESQEAKSVIRKLRRTVELLSKEIVALKAQILARDHDSNNVRTFPSK